MSGYFHDHTVQELLERGAVGFLQKPFELEELSQRIAEWLSRAGGRSSSHRRDDPPDG
jgi:DNA-binding response OmpR family regulator